MASHTDEAVGRKEIQMQILDALAQGILLGGLYTLFAVGLSIMFGVMRIVNLAHGDFAILAAFLAILLVGETSFPVWLVVAITVPAFAAIGYFLQRTLFQQSLNSWPLSTLLVTFGMSIVIQNALLEAFSANPQRLDVGQLATASFPVGPIAIPYIGVLGLMLAILCIVAIELFLRRTATGRMTRAVSDDPDTARLTGANSRHIYGLATGIAFGAVAIAGLLLAARSSVEPTAGSMRLIFAFEAVVIGGLGSLWGTLVGGLSLGVVQTLVAHFDPSSSILAGHLLFLLVLAFRPQGLIPARSL